MVSSSSYVVSRQDLWHWRQQAQIQAKAADIPIAEIDWLLQEVAGVDRLTLRLGLSAIDRPLMLACSLDDLEAQWQRRVQQRIPVQYLAGSAPWRQYSLSVTPAVLIPRPETELIIDLAIAAVQAAPLDAHLDGHLDAHNLQPEQWADLGTGSGAIAIGLADAFPQAQIHAVDRSEAAVQVAVHNAKQIGLADRIQFYAGFWFEPLQHLKGELSGMVSNPPYIPTATLAELQPEVVNHEPRLALDGGRDGLGCIRYLVDQAPDFLRSGGIWLIEMMAGQSAAVTALLEAQGSYHNIQVHPDLAGINRFVLAYRR